MSSKRRDPKLLGGAAEGAGGRADVSLGVQPPLSGPGTRTSDQERRYRNQELSSCQSWSVLEGAAPWGAPGALRQEGSLSLVHLGWGQESLGDKSLLIKVFPTPHHRSPPHVSALSLNTERLRTCHFTFFFCIFLLW